MSQLAKKILGTFVEDKTQPNLPPMVSWVQYQCRYGILHEAVKRFCAGQPEPLDPALTLVECVSADGVVCSIPCRCLDHESSSPFSAEVRFKLNPATGVSRLVSFEVHP